MGEAFVELQNGIAAFDHRGIVLRDLDSGLIDFPSVQDGVEVYLCWISGETEIAFWHDLDAGYGGRPAALEPPAPRRGNGPAGASARG